MTLHPTNVTMHVKFLTRTEVEELLEWGASPLYQNNVGVTPLLAAACEGHAELTRLLLDCGSNVNHVDKRGRSALHGAVHCGRGNVCELLISSGADVNHVDFRGISPLMGVFLWRREIGLAKLLLEAGAEINCADNLRRTALFYALDNYYHRSCIVLLQYGACVKALPRGSVRQLSGLKERLSEHLSMTCNEMLADGADEESGEMTAIAVVARKRVYMPFVSVRGNKLAYRALYEEMRESARRCCHEIAELLLGMPAEMLYSVLTFKQQAVQRLLSCGARFCLYSAFAVQLRQSLYEEQPHRYYSAHD